MRLALSRRGLELEIGRPVGEGAKHRQRGLDLWPGAVYRRIAAAMIVRLLAENRALRHHGIRRTVRGGVIPYDSEGRRILERLLTIYCDRRGWLGDVPDENRSYLDAH